MSFIFTNGEKTFKTNVVLFEDKMENPIFVDYDSDRFNAILNHYRGSQKVLYKALEYDLERMPDAIGSKKKSVDIGGEIFVLGEDTYKKFPYLLAKDNVESMTQNWEMIDRDPETFRRIVSYLRNPYLFYVSDMLREEMDFYGIKIKDDRKEKAELLKNKISKSLEGFKKRKSRDIRYGRLNEGLDEKLNHKEIIEKSFDIFPGFGRRISCNLGSNGKSILSTVYLYVIITNADLRVDQIIHRLDFEVGGHRLNTIYGNFLQVNQELEIDEEIIKWSTMKSPDRIFYHYLIPIDLIHGFGDKREILTGEQINLTLEIPWDDTFFTNRDVYIARAAFYVHSIKDERASLVDQFECIRDNSSIPIRQTQFHGSEMVFSGSSTKSKLTTKLNYFNEMDGIFIIAFNCKNEKVKMDAVYGSLTLDGNIIYFDEVTNIIAQREYFGLYNNKVIYLPTEGVNASNIEQMILLLEGLPMEATIHIWTYSKNKYEVYYKGNNLIGCLKYN